MLNDFHSLLLYLTIFVVVSFIKSKSMRAKISQFFGNFFNTNQNTSLTKRQLQTMTERTKNAVVALENHQLPDYLKKRIEAQKEDGLPWTSGASASEWLLMKMFKLRPLGLIMGCAHYQIGYSIKDHMLNISSGTGSVGIGRFGVSRFSQEIKEYSAVFRETCQIALQRLQEEAALHGAHAVVDVKLLPKMPSLHGHQIEFDAIGTAVAFEGSEPPKEPILCTTSMIEFTKLAQAGTMPIGIALGTGVYYVPSSYNVRFNQSRWNGKNTELGEYNNAVYQTRNIALRQLHADVERIGGQGVLGYYTDFRVDEFENENHKRRDFIIQFLTLGTVLATNDCVARPKIKMVLDLTQR